MEFDVKSSFSWKWGFTSSSENWNGRLAMLGFIAILAIEYISGKNLISLIGLA